MTVTRRHCGVCEVDWRADVEGDDCWVCGVQGIDGMLRLALKAPAGTTLGEQSREYAQSRGLRQEAS